MATKPPSNTFEESASSEGNAVHLLGARHPSTSAARPSTGQPWTATAPPHLEGQCRPAQDIPKPKTEVLVSLTRIGLPLLIRADQ